MKGFKGTEKILVLICFALAASGSYLIISAVHFKKGVLSTNRLEKKQTREEFKTQASSPVTPEKKSSFIVQAPHLEMVAEKTRTFPERARTREKSKTEKRVVRLNKKIREKHALVFSNSSLPKEKIVSRKVAADINDSPMPKKVTEKVAVDPEFNPAPKPVEPPKKEPTHEGVTQFNIAGGLAYSRFDANTKIASVTLFSKPVSSAMIAWQQNWSQDFHSSIGWSYEAASMESPSVGAITGPDQLSISSFNVGIEKSFGHHLWTRLEGGSEDAVFVQAVSSGSSVVLQRRSIPYARLSLIPTFVRVESLELRGIFSLGYESSTTGTDFTIQSGYDYSADLEISQRFDSLTIFARAGALQKVQSTSLSNQTQFDLRSLLGLQLPLGRKDSR